MKRMTLWGENEQDERLIDQVLSGRKTVTCTPKVWYYSSPDEEPTVPGDLVAVFNARGDQKCVIEITENYEIEFGRVNLRIARGELNSTVEEFKKDHVFCWEKDLAAQGHTLDDSTVIVVEHFRLVADGQSQEGKNGF